MRADADDRQSDALVVTIDPVAVIVMCAREANHLPGGHVFVAAIDRIGQKAVFRVRQYLTKKRLGVEALELERAVLEALDDVVFLVVGQRGK